MKTVLDSNVLFSDLISGKEFYIDIFRAVEIYVSDFIFIELSKYQEEIIDSGSNRLILSSFRDSDCLFLIFFYNNINPCGFFHPGVIPGSTDLTHYRKFIPNYQ